MTSSSLNGLEDVFCCNRAGCSKKAVQQRCSEGGPLWRAFQHSIRGIEGCEKGVDREGSVIAHKGVRGDNDVEV